MTSDKTKKRLRTAQRVAEKLGEQEPYVRNVVSRALTQGDVPGTVQAHRVMHQYIEERKDELLKLCASIKMEAVIDFKNPNINTWPQQQPG